MKRQMPGQFWTFTLRITGEKVAGKLPTKRGKSNKFALWSKSRNRWISRRNNVLVAMDWYRKNLKRGRFLRLAYMRKHPELRTVQSHHWAIFKSGRKNYAEMPFFKDWNPEKGGSYQVGADWIISNLGKRSEGSTLHIIEHEKGFMPGNLEWTYPRQQSNQQMFKIIAQQKHRIKELKKQIVRLKKRLDKQFKLC